jgi:hypothetical protein
MRTVFGIGEPLWVPGDGDLEAPTPLGGLAVFRHDVDASQVAAV